MAFAINHESINALAMLQPNKASRCTSQSVMREALVGDKLVSSFRFNPSTSAGQALHILGQNSQHYTFVSGHGSDPHHLHANNFS